MSNQGTRAVGYIRVSTKEQADSKLSLIAQEKALRAYCTMRGLELVEVVSDPAVGAGKAMAKRRGGARVLQQINGGLADAVVGLKLDRLFRNCRDCLNTVEDWDNLGVAMHLVDLGGQAVDTYSAMGRFFLTVMAGAAEMERNLISERTQAAMDTLKEQGRYRGGEPPYGFRTDQAGKLQPDPDEQEMIDTAKRLRELGLSYRKIGAALTERDMQPRNGGKWHAVTVRTLVESGDA